MTENEVIKELHSIRPRGSIIPQKRAEALDMAIQALEKQSMVNEILHELREYSTIGTIEEFKALKEKSVAKKVIRWADGSEHCPCCDFDNSAIGYGVCIDCGQKLDWSE